MLICFSSSFLLVAKLDGVKTYMRIRRVPKNVQNKVIKWFDYLWLTQNSSDEERAIQCLPGEKTFATLFAHSISNTSILFTASARMQTL